MMLWNPRGGRLLLVTRHGETSTSSRSYAKARCHWQAVVVPMDRIRAKGKLNK